MHLKLQVFFENHESPRYQFALSELYDAVKDFLNMSFNCGIDLRYAPNYIMQMSIAAAVALLKLLNSFYGFGAYADREAGERLFWDAIEAVRKMSVRTNDLPVRLCEVFAQMWNAWDTARTDGPAESILNGEVDASLTLKRRYRMSMSHVFDSIWRWKEELHGERDKLKDALKNPTSPVAMTHRGSFSNSNGRRPSSSLLDEKNADIQGMPSFGGFGGVPLGQHGDVSYAMTSYDSFDPMGWYLNELSGSNNMSDPFGANPSSQWM